MWIRSQRRQFIAKVDFISLKGQFVIGYQAGDEYEFELGQYKNEAEAMTVIDKIQAAIAIGNIKFFNMP